MENSATVFHSFRYLTAHDYHYPSNSLIITSIGAISRDWIDYLKIKIFLIFDEVEPNSSIETVEKIISQFKIENFVWMGNLEYPNEIKKFMLILNQNT